MKSVKIVFVLLLLAVQFAKAQDTSIVVSANMFDKFSDQLSLANNNAWLFRPGNDSDWAQPDIDPAGWIKLNPVDLSKKYADKNGRVEGWFRIKLKFDSSLLHKVLWIDFANWVATQFYIDSKLKATRGNTGDNGKPFGEYNDDLDPLVITFNSDTAQSFAIHFVGYLSPRLSYHGLRAKDKNFNAEIKTGFDPSIGKINIVSQDIGRVLLNLFNNAFYAVSKRQEAQGKEYEPSVSVATKKTGNSVIITVSDNGDGIPGFNQRKNISTIFYYQAPRQRNGFEFEL